MNCLYRLLKTSTSEGKENSLLNGGHLEMLANLQRAKALHPALRAIQDLQGSLRTL